MKNKIYLFLFISTIISLNAFAQPANNACSGAQTVTPDGTCYAGTTVGATDLWTGTVGCQSGNNAEVWYTFVATGTSLAVNVTAGTIGGNIEFTLVSATGACSGLALAGSLCGASPLTGTISGLVSGTTYYYTISSTGAAGTFTTCVTNTTPPPVPGQDCTAAAPLCSNTGFSQGTFTGVGTVENIATNSCFGANEKQSKWYTFTAGSSGTLEFNISPTVASNDYDWAVWNTTSGCYSSGTTMGAPIACNWSGCAGTTGITSAANPCTSQGATDCAGMPGCQAPQWSTSPPTLTAGQTYTILIDNFGSSGNGFNLTFGGTVTMGPNATFTTSLSGDCMTLTVTRTPYYTGANMTYTWNFGDGFTSTAGLPGSHTYTTTGVYTVSLTVTDANGCVDAFSIPVNIGCVPLPIKLLSFDANYNGKNVDLKWVTASENNNDFYTVERTTNGKDFEFVATIKGAGNSSNILNYETVDASPYYGLAYYRLKQTDFDGKFEYSELVAVTIKNNNETFAVYPNPTGNNAEVSFNAYVTDDAVLNIMDATGRLVLSKKVSAQKGMNTVKLDTDNYTKGIYFVTLTNKYEVLKTKFIKE